jgi:pyruvate dehydrogenase E2 component (dihydrolipoamide acetyltransferase)
MATNVILPALGIAQETGKVLEWLKGEGAVVTKGETLAEIETDKATVELEAPASGTLSNITAAVGEDVPVGNVIALILAPGELPASKATPKVQADRTETPLLKQSGDVLEAAANHLASGSTNGRGGVASNYSLPEASQLPTRPGVANSITRLLPASPKARRLAAENHLDLAAILGNGPAKAVLTADVLLAVKTLSLPETNSSTPGGPVVAEAPLPSPANGAAKLAANNTWRIMAERLAQSWASVPHFYLAREVDASRLVIWREKAQKRATEKVTFTDLLVKLVAVALRSHPRLNASFNRGELILNESINIGLAVALDDGLVVPVIRDADKLSLSEIAARRINLVARAQNNRLRLEDISEGTFTISNLGMYGVDHFQAIVNPPQAAILAVGRILDKVVPVNGQALVQPVISLSLSCDHRVVDGARGARFLEELADLIEEPLGA